MQSLWVSIADSIRKLPRHDSITLQSLAIIISAGLESRRKVIVNSSIKVWNDTFGAQDSLEYPSRVRVVMKKLRPIADISLPNFPEDIDEVYIAHPPVTASRVDQSQIVPTPPVWEDSQESQPTVNPLPWSSPIPASRHCGRTAPPTVDPISPSSKDFITRLREASSKATKPMTRLKHLDSQLDFAPIAADSQVPTIDSQLLTEHQREVRGRQQEEAAKLFSEIGIEQAPEPRRQMPPIKGLVEKTGLSEQMPQQSSPDRSPSIDEFVDAPEENADEAPKQNNGGYADEAGFVPATAFTVQVPKRVRLDKKPAKRVRAGPSNVGPSEEQDMLSGERPEDLEVSSRYFITPKGTRLSRRAKESSVENNTQTKQRGQYDNEEIFPVTQRPTPEELEDAKKATNPEVIPDSLEIYRIPNTPSPAPEVPSTKCQGAMPEREQRSSVVEVPDSFVQDGPDVRMTDSHEAPGGQEAEKHTVVQVNTVYLQEPLQLPMEAEGGTKKSGEARGEAKVGEMRTSKPGPPERPRRVGPRRSLQIHTTTPEAEGREGDNAILDCIMVTPATPRKEQVFPIVPETTLRKDVPPNPLFVEPSQDSPLSMSTTFVLLGHAANVSLDARKRKQRVQPVEEAAGKFDIQPYRTNPN